MIEVSLYGKKSGVLGWQELFLQEKIPYKYKGEKVKHPSEVNIFVGDFCSSSESAYGVFIVEPDPVNFSKDKSIGLISSFFDTNDEKVAIASSCAYLKKMPAFYMGKFKTHTGYNNDIYPLVTIRRNLFQFNLNISAQLNTYGFTTRDVNVGIKNLEMTLQISPYDRAGILRFLKQVLLRAFDAADIPYVHLWYYPDNTESVFIFRQDVDYVDVKGISKLVKVTKDFNIKGTYFINIDGGEEYEDDDAGEHQTVELKEPTTPKRSAYLEPLLNTGNEFANHGYIHDVFGDATLNLKNLKRCSDYLYRLFKVKDVGYASPGGIYTLALGEALNKCKFEYCSNLTLGTGGFPYYPKFSNKINAILEIPFYILSDACFEPFAKAKWQKIAAKEFSRYIDQQLSRNEPICLMGHPHISGRVADIFYPAIFKKVNKNHVSNMLLREYCTFWKTRAKQNFSYNFVKNKLKIETKEKHITVCIIYKSLKKLVNIGPEGFSCSF